jgi:hypothetical protein
MANSCACGPTAADEMFKVALPIVAVRVKGQGQSQYINTHALLDPGSNKSFCSKGLLDQLGLEGTDTTLSLSTLNDGKESPSKAVALEVTSTSGRSNKRSAIQLPTVYSIEKFPSLTSCVASQADAERWSHLSNIELPCGPHGPQDVTLLIGQDVPQALIPLEVREGKDFEPYAIRTRLGWIMNGPMESKSHDQQAICNFISAVAETQVSLESQVEQFWKIDTAPELADVLPQMSVDDKKVINIWDNSITLCEGHYQMDIPFKSDPPELPNNRAAAEKRLLSLGRRLAKDTNLHERYKAGINDLLNKGYAEPVPDDELNASPGTTWYIPHHTVVNPNKPEKLRIVFDCAAEYQGTSLNKNVLQGPDLTNSLIGVLLRF